MPVFEVEIYELHASKLRVEADDADQAIEAVQEGDLVDGSFEYIGVAHNHEMTDEKRERLGLAEDTNTAGVRDVEPVD